MTSIKRHIGLALLTITMISPSAFAGSQSSNHSGWKNGNKNKSVHKVKVVKRTKIVKGMRGPKGKKGDTGEKGMTGAPGAPGAPGMNGIDGIDGKDGAKGHDGKDGKDGIDGKDGAAGADGKDGIDGKDGVDGTKVTYFEKKAECGYWGVGKLQNTSLSKNMAGDRAGACTASCPTTSTMIGGGCNIGKIKGNGAVTYTAGSSKFSLSENGKAGAMMMSDTWSCDAINLGKAGAETVITATAYCLSADGYPVMEGQH